MNPKITSNMIEDEAELVPQTQQTLSALSFRHRPYGATSLRLDAGSTPQVTSRLKIGIISVLMNID